MTGKGINSLVPEDGSAFSMLSEIIQYEPLGLFEMEQLGKLASRDPDSRNLWMYSAIVVSPMLISKNRGAGTSYLTSFKDTDGVYLDGAKNYRLNIPANVPVKRFWAVTIYDPSTRSLLENEGPNTVTSMNNPDLNSDGSVDVYFGPKAPKDKENNWVLNDIELVKWRNHIS